MAQEQLTAQAIIGIVLGILFFVFCTVLYYLTHKPTAAAAAAEDQAFPATGDMDISSFSGKKRGSIFFFGSPNENDN